MAIHRGSEGKVIIGGSGEVGEVRSFSVEETADTLETTIMGQDARGYLSSLTSWSGSFDVLWDEVDAGQGGIQIASQISISFRPEGQDSGDVFYSGSAIITGLSINSSFDGLVESSVNVQGVGSLSKSIQP